MLEIADTVHAPVPQAASNNPRTRRALLFAGALCTAAATFIVGSLGGPTGNGPTAFAVSRAPDGDVAIRVVNSDVSARSMTSQLRARGLRITVTAEPASPQLVGRWVGLGASGDVPGQVVDAIGSHMAGSVATLEVPASFQGELRVVVGRAPSPGEQVAAAGEVNAASPGGLLHCLRLSGSPASEAALRLQSAGYDIHWLSSTGSVPAGAVDAPPAGIVVEAIVEDGPAARGGNVYLRVATPSDPRYTRLLWSGYSASAEQTGVRDYSDCQR